MTRPLAVLAQIVSAEEEKKNKLWLPLKNAHIQNVKWLSRKNLSEQQEEYEDIIKRVNKRA
jgi:hypothetical protein